MSPVNRSSLLEVVHLLESLTAYVTGPKNPVTDAEPGLCSRARAAHRRARVTPFEDRLCLGLVVVFFGVGVEVDSAAGSTTFAPVAGAVAETARTAATSRRLVEAAASRGGVASSPMAHRSTRDGTSTSMSASVGEARARLPIARPHR
jgi:hypothetical protein